MEMILMLWPCSLTSRTIFFDHGRFAGAGGARKGDNSDTLLSRHRVGDHLQLFLKGLLTSPNIFDFVRFG